LNTIKQKEEKSNRLSKRFNQLKNLFQQSEGTEKLFDSKKIVLDSSRKKTIQPSIRTFPNKFYNDVPKLFKNKITDIQVPKKPKPVLGNPTFEYKKSNDKKNLLPFEFEEMYDKKYIRTQYHLKIKDTTEGIFSERSIQKKKQTETTKKAMKLTDMIPANKDNLGSIIEYRNGPNFRKEVFIY